MRLASEPANFTPSRDIQSQIEYAAIALLANCSAVVFLALASLLYRHYLSHRALRFACALGSGLETSRGRTFRRLSRIRRRRQISCLKMEISRERRDTMMDYRGVRPRFLFLRRGVIYTEGVAISTTG